MKKSLIVILIIVIVVGGYLALGKKTAVAPDTTLPVDSHDMVGMSTSTATSTTSGTGTSAPAVTPGSTSSTNSSGSQNVKEFVIEGNNFSFIPAQITVKKGDRVRIILKNTGGFHDLVIDEFGVATKKINGNAQDTVEFVADKIGSFEYYCSVGTHRQMGMKGTLTVTQ